ncbi:MAG: hypothetical protein IKI20_00345 [Lachnospiraceae bacterium]|nr:hypothetical protein [Lachnospiraceae bacterium]
MIFIVLGVMFGLLLSVSLAYYIAATALLKSNDFGDDVVDLQTFAGYDPIAIQNVGQVSGSKNFFR